MIETTTEAVACPQATPELGNWFVRAARLALFFYTACVLCPISFWPIECTFDGSWFFASNYGPAHGLANGRDFFWVTGPLGYLAFPQDLGNNLEHALIFQVAVWGVLILAVADLFFIARFPLRNAALFAVFVGLSAPLYWSGVGLESLLLAGALLWITVYRWRGARVRYVAALVMMGIVPLIKLTGGMLAAGAVAGFLIDRALNIRWKVAGDALLAMFVPPLVAGSATYLLLWPFDFGKFLKVNLETVRGYSVAMSLAGPKLELLACFEVLALIGAVLWWQRRHFPARARFNFLLLAIPLALSVKHGFVRQDSFHTVLFFCFAPLALALIFLSFPLPRGRGLAVLAVLGVFGVIWQDYATAALGVKRSVAVASGIHQISLAWKAARGIGYLRNNLRPASQADYMKYRIERDLRAAIGDADVGALSTVYSWAAMDGLRLQLYPTLQRFDAYTPYLDGLNADWIRDRGPRFLICDLQTIDGRNLLAETPATWLEVYRWYDTRLLGSRHLLLERRTQPQFESLQLVARGRGRLYDELPIPTMQGPVFLTMKYSLSRTGMLASQFLRVPEVRMSVSQSGQVRSLRIIPEVLIAPTLVNYAPTTLPELAALFQKDGQLPATGLVTKLTFEGPGLSYYNPDFEFELYGSQTKLVDGFRPVP